MPQSREVTIIDKRGTEFYISQEFYSQLSESVRAKRTAYSTLPKED